MEKACDDVSRNEDALMKESEKPWFYKLSIPLSYLIPMLPLLGSAILFTSTVISTLEKRVSLVEQNVSSYEMYDMKQMSEMKDQIQHIADNSDKIYTLLLRKKNI